MLESLFFGAAKLIKRTCRVYKLNECWMSVSYKIVAGLA
jgi:hypothetical protein